MIRPSDAGAPHEPHGKGGAGIGVSISEANYSQTKTDFVMKLHAALKATAETEYWIRLLRLSE